LTSTGPNSPHTPLAAPTWFQGLDYEVSRADRATPAAYPASARNLIRSQKAVKLKVNAVAVKKESSVSAAKIKHPIQAEQARQACG